MSEERLEVLLPMEKSRLISLPVNMEYDLYFFTEAGLFRCNANALDVYKSNNNFVLLFETISELKKFQRREYYRLDCAVEMYSRLLEREEISAVVRNDDFLAKELPLKKGVAVDISGGGIRFVGNYTYERGDLIYCRYNLGGGNTGRSISIWIPRNGKKLSALSLKRRESAEREEKVYNTFRLWYTLHKRY